MSYKNQLGETILIPSVIDRYAKSTEGRTNRNNGYDIVIPDGYKVFFGIRKNPTPRKERTYPTFKVFKRKTPSTKYHH